MNRVVLITGGNIDIQNLGDYIENSEVSKIIAVDGGLSILDKMRILPDYIVGDFDTISEEILSKYLDNQDIEIIRLIPEKDFTDTHTALEKAIELKPDEIVIFGGVGTRMDHSISNIQLLQCALYKGIKAYILDNNNKIYLINGYTEIEKSKTYGNYISLIPLSEKVKGVTLKGFKYPLDNFDFDIRKSVTLGVSNEIVEDKAVIEIESGIFMVFESKD